MVLASLGEERLTFRAKTFPQRETQKHDPSLSVRIGSPYTNHFIFWFVFQHCLRSTTTLDIAFHISAVHQHFYILICISTLPTQHNNHYSSRKAKWQNYIRRRRWIFLAMMQIMSHECYRWIRQCADYFKFLNNNE